MGGRVVQGARRVQQGPDAHGLIMGLGSTYAMIPGAQIPRHPEPHTAAKTEMISVPGTKCTRSVRKTHRDTLMAQSAGYRGEDATNRRQGHIRGGPNAKSVSRGSTVTVTAREPKQSFEMMSAKFKQNHGPQPGGPSSRTVGGRHPASLAGFGQSVNPPKNISQVD